MKKTYAVLAFLLAAQFLSAQNNAMTRLTQGITQQSVDSQAPRTFQEEKERLNKEIKYIPGYPPPDLQYKDLDTGAPVQKVETYKMVNGHKIELSPFLQQKNNMDKRMKHFPTYPKDFNIALSANTDVLRTYGAAVIAAYSKNMENYRQTQLPNKKPDQDISADLNNIFNKSVIDVNKNNAIAQSDNYFDSLGEKFAAGNIPDPDRKAQNYKEAYNSEMEDNARIAMALGGSLSIPYFMEAAQKTNAYYQQEIKQWLQQ